MIAAIKPVPHWSKVECSLCRGNLVSLVYQARRVTMVRREKMDGQGWMVSLDLR